MAGLTFKVDLDTRGLTAMLQQYGGAALKTRLRAALNESAGYLQGEVQKRTAVRTGKLRGSVFSRLVGDTTAEVGYPAAVPYGVPYELGQRAHVIRPVRARALAWKGAAHPVRMVNHPGAAGRHAIEGAAKAAGPTVGRIFAKVFGS